MEERRLPGRSAQQLFDDAEMARRFQRRLREVGPPGGHARAAFEYDESGYPIERNTGLAARVRRLITG
ncbi:MAG: hypothetical protein QOG41_434 [Thermoleophilaceae bacterium]|jgi:hypothetical protein|nr:hypothetical protein [Thermoleophilaceae bacterium]MEA2387661.1 hypothetical protein [Thermoleophilaceae bacterium]